MNKLIVLLPFLLFFIIGELDGLNLILSVYAFVTALSFYYSVLYILNRRLALPLSLFEKEQTMIDVCYYYSNASKSWLYTAGILALFFTAGIGIFDFQTQQIDTLVIIVFYIILYSIIGYYYNFLNEIQNSKAIDENYLPMSKHYNRLIRFSGYLILFLSSFFILLNWKLNTDLSLFHFDSDFLNNLTSFILLFIAPKIFIYIITTILSLFLLSRFILKVDFNKVELWQKVIPFQILFTGLFIILQSLKGNLSYVSSRATLFSLIVSVNIFLLFNMLFSWLMSLKISMGESSQYIKKIEFDDEKKLATLLFIFSILLIFFAFLIFFDSWFAILPVFILVVAAFLF